jgi:Leucine-rich repeat (LRR) protein
MKISRNCLAELPNNLFELKSIFDISIEHNSLQRLPNTIGILRNLCYLSLDYNYLKELPDEICSCSSLRILSLRENFLTQLPANIGQLKQLKILNVINNNLTFLPLSINNVRNVLKALWISDQQIKPLPSLQMAQSSDGSMNVLSCFMLPQSKYSGTQVESGQGQQEKVNTDSMVRKKLLRFEKDVEEKATPISSKKEKLEKIKHSLNRSPTPHPSELKKMASTAHHIASGTAQLKKTGGKTYRSYGKIDDVAVSYFLIFFGSLPRFLDHFLVFWITS